MARRAIKTLVLVLVLLLLAIVGGCIVISNPTGASRFDSKIEVSPQELRRDVAALINSGDGYRNFTNLAALNAAAATIRSEWERAGFEVTEQPFDVAGNAYKNLIISYGPDDAPVLVMGAHYDVCGEQDGADDNASGVAAILALARLLATEKPQVKHRIELVAFTLEEPPFFRTNNMGSAVHAAALAERGVEVKGMIALDLIGYFSDKPGSQMLPLSLLKVVYPTTGNFICVVGDLGNWGLTRSVKKRMKGACGIPVESINAPSSIPGVDFSDHLSYWRRGFPAVLVTDTALYRNPNYHLPSDTIDTLDFDKLAEVVKGLYAVLVGL